MVFEMQGGAEVIVSAVIQGNRIRATGQDAELVVDNEINPTNGMVIRTK